LCGIVRFLVQRMNIHIPTRYLVYTGLAVAAGLAYWYLKSNGIWDSWFSPSGALIPVGQTQPVVAQPQQSSGGFSIPGSGVTPGSGYVN
jgi:hypothetical protein